MGNSQELSFSSGSYLTLCALASGGMGRVDLAVRKEGSFERLFAVKRLKAEFADDAEVRAMFLDEARIAGLIRHPHVVSVMDLGEDDDGPYLVMQYVEGITVGELISEKSAQPLPMEVALKIVIHTAEGLHAAHELRGPDGARLDLVHRDVSPQNIMLGFDGVALVTDFGIAKAMGRTSKTSTGVLKGKLGYLAPEQLRFEEPDRRADLFALGVVLFEMLTARRLYKSTDGTDGPRRILTEPPPDLADFRDDAEPELVELLFELLAKRREDRPSDAKIVSRRLEAILAGVVAGGDSVDVAAFLNTHFASRREEMRERVNSVRKTRSQVARLGTLASATELEAMSVKSRSWPKRALLSLGVFVGIGGIAGLAISRLRTVEEAPTTADSSRLSVAKAKLAIGSASASALDSPPLSPRTSGSLPSPSEPAPRPTAIPTRERSSASASPRVQPKPKGSPKPKGVPMWEDY